MTTPQKGRIFISYRRADTSFAAGRIYDRLIARFGDEAVFMDVDTIDAGVDFVKVLEESVQSCDVLVALIGKQWLIAKDTDGGRRLDNSKDFVRIEIVAALNRNIRVIPVLVNGVKMPSSTELPENLKILSRRNAVQVKHDTFNSDARRLISALENALEAAENSNILQSQEIKKALKHKKMKGITQLFHGKAVLISLGIIVFACLIFGARYIFPNTPTSDFSTPTHETIETSITLAPESENLTKTPEEVPVTPATDIPDTEDNMMTSSIDGMILNYIPAGEFKMGSQNGPDDEFPAHSVYLDSYWIDQTEVTNAKYALCVEAGKCDSPKFTKSYLHENYYGNVDFSNYPVIYVSWDDANNYCSWAGRRLPTEAEWEKAARGGLEEKKYPWGNNDPICKERRNYGAKYDDNAQCNHTGTERIETYPPNSYGLYDMSGNVWEWVADWYDENYYANAPKENPQGPKIGDFRVMRGGAWSSDKYDLRSASRYRDYLTTSHSYIGFRCSRSP